MSYIDLKTKRDSFSGRFWDLKMEGLDPEVIEKTLIKEGCPSLAEIEKAFINEYGKTSEEIYEEKLLQYQIQAEERYLMRG